MKFRIAALIWLVSAAAALSAPSAQAGLVASSDTYAGRSYGEWEARWWQAGLAIPVVAGDHPLFSGGAFFQESGVTFLAAAFGTNTYNVTIPHGMALFFPMLNAECSVFEADPFHGDDEASLRACANGHIDHTSGVAAEIDGVAVDVSQFRVESPLFQWGPLPADNIFGAPAGTTSDAVDAGYYLLVTPLSVGKHVIHTTGTFDDFALSGDATFNITVTPEPTSMLIFGMGGVALAGYSWRRRRGII